MDSASPLWGKPAQPHHTGAHHRVNHLVGHQTATDIASLISHQPLPYITGQTPSGLQESKPCARELLINQVLWHIWLHFPFEDSLSFCLERCGWWDAHRHHRIPSAGAKWKQNWKYLWPSMKKKKSHLLSYFHTASYWFHLLSAFVSLSRKGTCTISDLNTWQAKRRYFWWGKKCKDHLQGGAFPLDWLEERCKGQMGNTFLFCKGKYPRDAGVLKKITDPRWMSKWVGGRSYFRLIQEELMTLSSKPTLTLPETE